MDIQHIDEFEDGPWSSGEKGIKETIIYDDGDLQLIQVGVMLDDIQIATCYQEKRKGQLLTTHYTLPTWYVRYKKLDEIL